VNVIDDQKLQSALTGVTDSVVKNLVTQVLPVIAALVDSAVAKLCDEAELVVGSAIAAFTAERAEAIMQLESAVHGVLDRLSLSCSITPRIKNS
jgi:hypothetical protein